MIKTIDVRLLLAFGIYGMIAQAQTGLPDVIRSTTELVQLTVTARGPHGAAINDLKATDFEILDKGRHQAVATFVNNSVDEAGGSGERRIPQLGTFSNAGGTGSHGGVTVLLLDAADTEHSDWERGWPHIVSFVRKLRSEERVAIYSLDRVHGLQVLQDYDSGHEQLLKALAQAHATVSTLLRPPVDELPGRVPAFASRSDQGSLPELLSFGTVRGLSTALQVISRHLANAEGTKSLIWFASNFPDPFQRAYDRHGFVMEPYRVDLLRAINSLLLRDVTIYPVDARGLMPDDRIGAENGDVPIGAVEPGSANSMHLADFSTLLELASRSGGKAYINTNGFEQSFADVLSSAKSTYTIGFYLSEPADNTFHSLRVSVKRSGVHLRYRPGYWHFAAPPSNADRSNQDLKAVLDSPFTVSGIVLQADRLRPQSLPHVTTTLHIDSANLRLDKQQKGWRGTLQLISAQRDSRGRVFATPPRDIPVELSKDVRVSGQWLKMQIPITLRADSRTVRIAVRDPSSGLAGSIDIPVD